MINFNQLRAFYYVARHQSFTEAAEKLNVTQPAVTAQVKLLQDQWGLKLFRKRGRMIRLTDQGRVLYDHVAKIFEYERAIENLIEEMKKLQRGTLRLGTTKTYARYFMPLLIARFHKAFPGIKIHLDEGSSLEMIHSLLELRNEVAIIAKVEDPPGVSFIPFSHEELVLILPPYHRLASRKSLSPEEIADQPVIMKETGSGTRKTVNQWFARKGLSPNILMETSNTEFIKQLVQRGDGLSFIVKEAVAMELKQGKLAAVALEGERVFLDVQIAYLDNQPLSPPALAFLEMLRKLAPNGIGEKGIREILDKISMEGSSEASIWSHID